MKASPSGFLVVDFPSAGTGRLAGAALVAVVGAMSKGLVAFWPTCEARFEGETVSRDNGNGDVSTEDSEPSNALNPSGEGLATGGEPGADGFGRLGEISS